MIPFARTMVLALAVLSIVYVCLYFYVRAARRERFEREWWEETRDETQDDWVDARMAAGEASMRRWLFIGVYVIPLILFAILVYVTNFT